MDQSSLTLGKPILFHLAKCNSQAPLHPVIGGGLGSFEVSPNYHMAFEAFVLV